MKEIFKEILSQFLQMLGVLSILVTLFDFFGKTEWVNNVKNYWGLLFILLAIICYFRLRPKTHYTYQLYGTDINIELIVGDIFEAEGAIIVGSNTGFVTDNQIIASNSIQGIFTTRYMPNIQSLNTLIRGQVDEGLQPFGTTVTVQAGHKIGYFCAIAEVNNRGSAHSNIHNIRLALGGLWEYLGTHGDKEILNVPILGSGFSRVSAKREELFRELVRSFIASTSAYTYCEGLRIFVYPDDVKSKKMDIQGMAEFLKYNCLYSFERNTNNEHLGQPPVGSGTN